MPRISRRTLLGSSLALSATSLFPGVTHGLSNEAQNAAPDAEQSQQPASGKRERLLFDFGWKFKLGNSVDPQKDFGFGFGQSDFSKTGTFRQAKVGFDDSSWRTLNLPHDWAVELPFEHDDSGGEDDSLRSHGYKPLGRRYPENSVGWYRREFDVPASDAGRRISVEFDGVFRDTLIFVNGCFLGRNTNGYVPFAFDLTDFLVYGGHNCITVRADATFGDGWFYEGAGIYRHVWLVKTDAVHVGRWETAVRSTPQGDAASLQLQTVVQNQGTSSANVNVAWTIRDANGNVVAKTASPSQTIPSGTDAHYEASTRIASPELWSLEKPSLYTAVISVRDAAGERDSEVIPFGIRTATFDAAKGFFLNGKPVKIQGTCNHQDHAGLGVALPDRMQTFRLDVLRSMGCNAVRSSHNMPTPEWVEACDREGVLMMCETRQMSSNPEGLAQLETMIKRFRNSPSIILWSIGNEEGLLQKQMAEQGAGIATTMVQRCHQLDPTRPVTAAVNFDNEHGPSVPLDVIGFNYHEQYPDGFHKKYPNRPVFGSETSSAISTRGEYYDDPARNYVNSYNGVVPWGATPEKWWNFYGTREWEAGGFAWTGFDYRGEPTPYGWPSINSQFGIVDMCGYPKDYFFYYAAWWRTQPSLHVFPHWNWHGREGDPISVWVYSNQEEVELLLNGKSLGRKTVPHLGHMEWTVPYHPGVLEARAHRSGKVVLTEKRETTGAIAALRLTAYRRSIAADGEDVGVVRVEAVDAQGRVVPTAKEMVSFEITGDGHLLGVGNGDPNCLESDKEPKRSVFNGLAQVIVQATRQAGSIRVRATLSSDAANHAAAELVITTTAATARPAVPVPAPTAGKPAAPGVA